MPSVSQKQHNFMGMIKHSPEMARKAGVPQSVGADFIAADKAKHKFADGGGTGNASIFAGNEQMRMPAPTVMGGHGKIRTGTPFRPRWGVKARPFAGGGRVPTGNAGDALFGGPPDQSHADFPVDSGRPAPWDRSTNRKALEAQSHADFPVPLPGTGHLHGGDPGTMSYPNVTASQRTVDPLDWPVESRVDPNDPTASIPPGRPGYLANKAIYITHKPYDLVDTLPTSDTYAKGGTVAHGARHMISVDGTSRHAREGDTPGYGQMHVTEHPNGAVEVHQKHPSIADQDIPAILSQWKRAR